MPAQKRPAPEADPIDELLTMKRGKWTVVVILQLRGQTLRFSELKRNIPGLSQKTLTVTLRTLERDGIVSRTTFATIPPRVDYALTALGYELLRVFEAWEEFSRQYWSDVIASRERFDSHAAMSIEADPPLFRRVAR